MTDHPQSVASTKTKGPATQPARRRPRTSGARGPHTFRKNPGKRPRKGGSSR